MNLLCRMAACCAAIIWSAAAQAAGYPDHSVKVIVPFAAGGPTDVMARIVAQKLSASLGQQFYVEDHPGAGGNLGMALAANAAPDGYTLLFVSSSLVVNPSLYRNVPYDVFKGLAPITLAATSPNVLVVHPSFPAKTAKEFIDYVKAHPGTASFASPGIGTTAHLAAEVFIFATKLDMVHVPYNGAGPALNSVVGNHTPIAFMALPPAAPQIKQGTLRALAVTSKTRSEAVPDVPTMAEAGVPGDQVSDVMQGFLAPGGTPRDIIDKLRNETVKAIALPDVKATFAKLGFEALGDTPDEFAARIKAEVPKWAAVIKNAKIETQ